MKDNGLLQDAYTLNRAANPPARTAS